MLLGTGIAWWPPGSVDWRGGADLHDGIESLSALLALTAGGLILRRFHRLRLPSVYLLVGTGFLGAGLLDGLNLLTGNGPAALLPGASLGTSTWTASRTYLALSLCLAWLSSRSRFRAGAPEGAGAALVYAGSLLLLVLIVAYVLLVPVPELVLPGRQPTRPIEFVPGLLFLVALAGFLNRRAWRRLGDVQWLMLSLTLNAVSQCVYMPFSAVPLDFESFAAQVLKGGSYLVMVVPLLVSPRPAARAARTARRPLARGIPDSLRPGAVGGRLLALIALLVTFAIGSIVITHIVTERRQLARNSLRLLDTVASGQATAIRQKLEEYLSDLRFLADNAALYRLLADHDPAATPEDNTDFVRERLQPLLDDLVRSDPRLRMVILHDASGRAIASAGTLWTELADGPPLALPTAPRIIELRHAEGVNLVHMAAPIGRAEPPVGALQAGSKPVICPTC